MKTWLYRIAINRCREMLAAKVRQDRVAARAAPEPGDAGDGDSAMILGERDRALRSAVADLPEDRRVVVLLCYHAGITHPHAAEILGIPLGTLKSRLHAALAQLRRSLAQEEAA